MIEEFENDKLRISWKKALLRRSIAIMYHGGAHWLTPFSFKLFFSKFFEHKYNPNKEYELILIIDRLEREDLEDRIFLVKDFREVMKYLNFLT